MKVNGWHLTSHPKDQVDRNNIELPLGSILASFKEARDENNPYHQLLRTPQGKNCIFR